MVPAWLAKERTKWRHETPPGAKALIVEESTPEPEPETPRTPKKKTKGTSSQGASPQSKRKQAASPQRRRLSRRTSSTPKPVNASRACTSRRRRS